MMNMLALIIAAAAAGSPLAASASQFPATPAAREVTIYDAAGGGIRDWHSDDDRSIYLRDRTGRWYRATFLGVCPGVRHSPTIGVNTDSLGAFDRFSTITTYRGLCSVASVVRSAKPAAIGRR